MEPTNVLNDEQRRLVEENLRIVPFMLKKMLFPASEYQEMLAVGNLGLVKAAMTYKTSTGNKFSTYATICIRNEINMAMRGIKKRSRETSIENIITGEKSDNEDVYYRDIILRDTADTTSGIEEREPVEQILEAIFNMDSLTCIEKQLVFYKLGGMRQIEIGKRVNFSQSYVSRYLKRAFNKVRESINQNLRYERTIKIQVTVTEYRITIMLNDEKTCKLIHKILVEHMVHTEKAPGYTVKYDGDYVTISVINDIESLIIFADILQMIGNVIYINKKSI